jgi:hypothetical protein
MARNNSESQTAEQNQAISDLIKPKEDGTAENHKTIIPLSPTLLNRSSCKEENHNFFDLAMRASELNTHLS